MRQDTIYEILRSHRQNNERNWQESFMKEIVGSIVLTEYNNKVRKVLRKILLNPPKKF